MTRLVLGSVTVTIDKGRTLTNFGDGHYLVATHAEQPGQRETAEAIGMSVEEMNRTHDLAHSILARVLGLPHSPTLYGVASGAHFSGHDVEESAVLQFQRFAALMGVDLVEVARRLG